jgi:hypothetical protein
MGGDLTVGPNSNFRFTPEGRRGLAGLRASEATH